MHRFHLLFLFLIAFCGLSLADEQATWTVPVQARFSKSATDRRLVDKDAELILNDSARKLTVKNDQHPLELSYDQVQRIIFDVSTRMRGGAMSQVVGGVAGAAIASKHVSHYWCYIEARLPDGSLRSYMVEIAQDWSPKVIQKMQDLFAEKVTVADFPEHLEAQVARQRFTSHSRSHCWATKAFVGFFDGLFAE